MRGWRISKISMRGMMGRLRTALKRLQDVAREGGNIFAELLRTVRSLFVGADFECFV